MHLVFGCVGRSTVHAYLVGTTVVDRLTRKKKAWMDRTKSRIGYESLGIELGYKWLRCSFESNESSCCNVGEMAAEGVGSYRLPVVSVGIEWLQDGEGRLVGGWVDGHSR